MDDNDYIWYNDVSKQFLARDYLLPGWTLDRRVQHMSATSEQYARETAIVADPKRVEGLAGRIAHAISRGWWSFSTPVWTNFGAQRGLPISCFGSFVGDSIASMMTCLAETGMMSKLGGGTSAYFGSVRPRGSVIRDNGFASGPMHYLQMWETLISTVTQGSTRNANMAVWMDVEHPAILDFLDIRTDHYPLQKLHSGICVGDDWLRNVRASEQKLDILAKVVTQRNNTGEPYIMFRDTVNRNTVDVYKDKKMSIHGSNLCTEIALPCNEEESFVCCLSSLNAAHYDEWKDTDTVGDMVMFLDTVMTDFIKRCDNMPHMQRALAFARRHRALGIGVLGWHTLLQRKNLTWGSMEAARLNVNLFRQINQQAHAASRQMAIDFGEPEVLAGYGRRHTTLTAVAPTMSSATILGQVSKGIEPRLDNYHIVDTDKLKYTFRNQELMSVLKRHNMDTLTVWDSILHNQGSVQHLGFLTEHEREVFKTMSEISPMDLVTQAAQRQPYIDQGQSLNLFIHPSIASKDKVSLIMKAWEMGVKSLYYQFSENASQAFSANILQCSSCSA